MPDRTLLCVACRGTFVFGEREQAFFKAKGFQDPKRCLLCRRRQREQGRGAKAGGRTGGTGVPGGERWR